MPGCFAPAGSYPMSIFFGRFLQSARHLDLSAAAGSDGYVSRIFDQKHLSASLGLQDHARLFSAALKFDEHP
jgi:hypothetical protein